jgi:alcohol dehydrogenase
MKAAVLRALGTPLSIETVPDPVAGSGEVVVDVAAARVLAYANEVLSGARPYPVELPMIPGAGAIGRVVTLGPDATKLAIGDWVFCDPTVRARDDALAPDIILQGLIAPGPGPMKLHRHFHDGSWAERVRVPTENVTRIGAITAVDDRWCLLGTFLVPFGGLLAIGVRAGESVLVSGATGSFGAVMPARTRQCRPRKLVWNMGFSSAVSRRALICGLMRFVRFQFSGQKPHVASSIVSGP